LAQLVMAKTVLILVRRRCKHGSVVYPLELIPRLGNDYLAINLRPRLRCRRPLFHGRQHSRGRTMR
jgi:hypothetical protein